MLLLKYWWCVNVCRLNAALYRRVVYITHANCLLCSLSFHMDGLYFVQGREASPAQPSKACTETCLWGNQSPHYFLLHTPSALASLPCTETPKSTEINLWCLHNQLSENRTLWLLCPYQAPNMNNWTWVSSFISGPMVWNSTSSSLLSPI